VAGIDLLSTSEREADSILHALVRQLPAPTLAGSCLATHWARASERAHVSLSVELSGVDADAAWRLLAECLPAGDPTARAVCVGDRCTGPEDLRRLAAEAARAHAERRSGRVVHFPGVAELVGTLPVREVLERSAIDRVRVLAAGDADPAVLLTTREHVRPGWSAGELVLLAQPAVGGTLVPFESPNPTPCCADHA